MYCTHCGQRNPAGANFCANCGHALQPAHDQTTGSLDPEVARSSSRAASAVEAEEQPETVPVDELDRGTALLVADEGAGRGASYLLDRPLVTAGRHPDSDIFLDDITVSRRHAQFRRDADQYWVHDSGSLNGTYVNGERIEERRLRQDDEVQVGKFKLNVHLPGGR